MNKSIVRKFADGTPEKVIAHAVYRKSRGRRPTMAFRGIRDPRAALAAAVAASLSRKAVRFDPLDFAEKLVGGKGRESVALGFALHVNHTAATKNLLETADDTHYGMGVAEYRRIIGEEGFQCVLKIPFEGKSWGNGAPPKETFYVFWQPKDGILLHFDTFMEKDVNSSKFSYNWSPHNAKEIGHCLSSGGWRDSPKLWVGDHDGREALRLHIGDLRARGTFVTPWVEQPFLWLLHYMDTKDEGYDYKAINAERIAMLPKKVQRAIRAS